MSDETVREASAETTLFLPGLVVSVIDGADAGRREEMRARRFTVGTAPDNDLVLSDRSVSRHHLALESSPDAVLLIDLGSTNGTRVGGVRIVSAVAEPGQRVTLGGTTLELGVATSPVGVPLASRTSFGGLVGRSVPMRELYALLERAAASDASVLLQGETGTGKELAAEALHAESARAEGPFVVVDCGAIPPSLFESELFGHVKGAFTGAIRDQRGLLVEASGGTLFLDEVGELSPEVQPKLLRALERRQVRPVGASQPVAIDVRVVAATHRDLTEEMNRGAFREDLYFRLAVIRVGLPPLRRRQEDVPDLVRLFVERMAPDRPADVETIVDALAHRTFPGNVRELRNAVEEMLVLGTVRGHGVGQPVETASSAAALEGIYALAYEEATERALAHFQREYVHRLLARAGGNVSRAAREADMSRRYLQTLIQRLGIL